MNRTTNGCPWWHVSKLDWVVVLSLVIGLTWFLTYVHLVSRLKPKVFPAGAVIEYPGGVVALAGAVTFNPGETDPRPATILCDTWPREPQVIQLERNTRVITTLSLVPVAFFSEDHGNDDTRGFILATCDLEVRSRVHLTREFLEGQCFSCDPDRSPIGTVVAIEDTMDTYRYHVVWDDGQTHDDGSGWFNRTELEKVTGPSARRVPWRVGQTVTVSGQTYRLIVNDGGENAPWLGVAIGLADGWHPEEGEDLVAGCSSCGRAVSCELEKNPAARFKWLDEPGGR